MLAARTATAKAVQGRTRSACCTDRVEHHGVSLPAWHLEVEQNRAPPVHGNHHELARPTTHLAPGHRRSDRSDDHENRARCPSRTRRGLLPDRQQDQRPASLRTPRSSTRPGTYGATPSRPTNSLTEPNESLRYRLPMLVYITNVKACRCSVHSAVCRNTHQGPPK